MVCGRTDHAEDGVDGADRDVQGRVVATIAPHVPGIACCARRDGRAGVVDSTARIRHREDLEMPPLAARNPLG